MARSGVRRPGRRALAARRGRPPRRAPTRRDRGPVRGAAHARRTRRGDRRARGAHRQPPAPRAPLGPARCWRSTAPAGRRTRSPRTGEPGRSWPTSSGSTPHPSSAGSTNASCNRARSSRSSGSPLRGYRLLERIGSGSFGAVWRALQPEVGRDVAVKAIHPQLANDPEFIRRFETEAQIVARLEHPHIVPLYDYWREPGGAYLVMRYLRGGSLAERARHGGPLEPERVGAAARPGRRRARGGAPPRRRPPRREAEQHPARRGGQRVPRRLRHREGRCPRPRRREPGDVQGTLAVPRRPSRSAAGRSRRGPTCTRWAWSCTRCSSASTRSRRARPRRCSDRHLHEPLPSARERRPRPAAGVDEVIAARDREGPRRSASRDALAMAAAFRDAISPSRRRRSRRPRPIEIRNPYKGLRPFTRRTRTTSSAARPSSNGSLRAVASGPAPRRRASSPSSDRAGAASPPRSVPASFRPSAPARSTARPAWFITEMVPGAHPIEELEAALLRVAAQPPPACSSLLESGPRGLLRRRRAGRSRTARSSCSSSTSSRRSSR